jgi:molybdate transport system ATP-binding protein
MLDIDIRLEQGRVPMRARFRLERDVAGLFGESGSGKSRLLRVLAGLEQPDGGHVRLDGELLFDSRRGINRLAQSRSIALVSRDLAVDGDRTVRENLLAACAAADEACCGMAEIVELLELESLLDFRARNLSAGEAQRALLGRALLSTPSLLLLDDPLSALEVRLRTRILGFLRAIRERHRLGILYVSHALGEILQLTDFLILMAGGSIAGTGPLPLLMRDPALLEAVGLSPIDNILPVTILAHDVDHRCTLAKFFGVRLVLPYMPLAGSGNTYHLSLRSSEIALATRPIQQISIQNQIKGRVCAIVPRPDRMLVQVDVGTTLVVEVTRRALAALGIREGDTVYCLVKTHSFNFLATDILSDASATALRLIRCAGPDAAPESDLPAGNRHPGAPGRRG